MLLYTLCSTIQLHALEKIGIESNLQVQALVAAIHFLCTLAAFIAAITLKS